MRRIMTFLMGMVAGGLLLLLVLHYHLIRANDGIHVVPKTNPRLSASYVDIRHFGIADWANHADIAAALIQSDRRDLVDDAAHNALGNGLDRLLGRP